MTEAIAKKSGFYVGLLGSPGWETKHSVLIEGGPRHIFLPSENRIPSCRRFFFRSLKTTILPAQCEIKPTRLAPSNLLGDEPQLLNTMVLPPEISRPPPAVVPPKHSSLRFDTKYSLPTKVSAVSSFADFKDEQSFSNTYNSSATDITTPTQTLRTLVKHSRSPTDLLQNGTQQTTIKPLHFGKRRRPISENSQHIYSDNVNDSISETATQGFSALPPPRESCRQSVDLSYNSVWLKPRYSTLSRRTGNSIIGPSPLRTMFLPSDYDFEHTRKFNVNNCSTLFKIQSEAKFEPPPLESSSSNHLSPIPERSRTILQAHDPDVIFDLIRELAQETSAWDASLFVDENFKALIATHPISKPKVSVASEKRSKCRPKQRRTALQDIPESDGTKYNFSKASDNTELKSYFLVAVVFSQDSDNWHPDEAQSFWEDEIDSTYQHDAQLQPPSPGGVSFAY